MREGWINSKLGEVTDMQGGSQPPKSTFKSEPQEGYVRLLQIRDFKSDNKAAYIPISEKNRVCQHNDILLGRYGASVGKICTGKSGAYNVALMKVTPNEELLVRRYYLYYLTSPLFQKPLANVSDRSAQNGFSKADIFDFEIPIPPVAEQEQIVGVLDQAFEAIDKAKANIERNIENAMELYENWTFKTIQSANWHEVNWGEICDFTRGPFGGSLKKSMFVESGYAVYEQKQAIHNDYDALRYFIDEEKFQEMQRFKVKSGDLLMSCSGVTLGRISEVPPNAPAGIINQALLKLSTKPNQMLNDFLIIWIRSKIFQDLIFRAAGGAAQPNVPGVKILKSIKVPCPTIQEQTKFVELHHKMHELTHNSIDFNKKRIENIRELKKSILQKALAGELTGKEVEV